MVIATNVRSAHHHTFMLPAVAPLAYNFIRVLKLFFGVHGPVEYAPEVCTLRRGTQCVYHMED